LRLTLGLEIHEDRDVKSNLREKRSDTFERTLKLPVSMQDTRVLLRLLQLDLAQHGPGAPVKRVTIEARPATRRFSQGGLFAPLAPEPEKLEVTQYAALLRHELCVRNASYAALHQLPHVTSYGEIPVVVYQPLPCGTKHGNFIPASYKALQRRPQWKRRFEKVHSQAGRAFPKSDCVSKELDSSMSSDALLMNIFCYPGMTKRRGLSFMLGTESGDLPEFGFKPRIPLTSGCVERTEIDMKLGPVLFEAKLTESDFQTQKATIVEGYRDLNEVFDCRKLSRRGQEYVSYQLLRNVLAAYALNLSFCVLLDARRPDLREQWYTVMSCVRAMDLRTRCKILTWQELSAALPGRLQNFLELKYGIVS
jgi:hypothetical protein